MILLQRLPKLGNCVFSSFVIAIVFVFACPFAAHALNAGDRVEAGVGFYIRSTAGGSEVGSTVIGTQGTVIEGPTYADYLGTGYFWYNVNWDSGQDGWSIEAAMTLLTDVYNYTTNGGTVTITHYNGSGGDVSIPSTLDGLPVTSIGDNAFYGCTDLTSVTIPSGITNLGQSAFAFCSGLTGVTIPNSVIGAGGWVFYGCSDLTSATIGSGLATIGNSMFSSCSSLNSITIPANVTSIGDWAFTDCYSLTSVTIPNSVTNIGECAFSSCFTLPGITIPASVTSIGYGVFYLCFSLTGITVDSGNSYYSSVGGVMFNKPKTTLVRYPEGKTGSYVIPSSVTSIGERSFENCTGLTDITIPSTVVNIGDIAFYFCFNLTSITIPSSVTSIGWGVFLDCTNLNAITVDTQNAAYSSLDGVLFDKNQTTLLQCPAGRSGTYAIPATVTSIEEWAFDDCRGLTSVTVPSSVSSIVYAAFCDCTELSSVYFQGNAPDLGAFGQYLFDGSENVTVYYLGGTTGWGSTFGGRPAVMMSALALRFPLANYTPYTAPVSSVFDHSGLRYISNNEVMAFTGENGTVLDPTEPPVVIGGQTLYSYKKVAGTPFFCNGNYQGTSLTGSTTLNYDGHPGWDYKVAVGTPVYAAADGQVVVVTSDSASGKYIRLQHGSDYQSQYLHLNEQLVALNSTVTKGQLIGRSGNSGGVSAHLHFEVKRLVSGSWISVDPYGWYGSGADPYQVPNSVLWQDATLTVSAPNGGESYQAGTSLPISWEVGGNLANGSYFSVEYSLNGGSTWSTFDYVSGSGRSSSWAIPFGTVSSQARIRVRAFDAQGGAIGSDSSDGNFTITSGVSFPEAIPAVNYIAPASGVQVTFDGSASRPSAGNSITSYYWEFGDGTTSSDATVQRTFTASGTRVFTNWLTVTDSSTGTDTAKIVVTVTGQVLGPNTQSDYSDDPVNLATGNFIYDHKDMTIPGIGFPFEFRRFYNSQDGRVASSPVGSRWSHSYNIQLTNNNGVVNIVFGDGRSESYTNSSGTYIAEDGIHNVLTTNEVGGFSLTTKEQMQYVFDTAGRLAALVDKNSNTLSITYNGAGELSAITNSAGRTITFLNDASHRMTAIIDPLNRTNLFAYSAEGDLVSATDPRGGVTQYGYDAEHQMTNAVDPSGNEFVRNVYSSNKVVESQKDAFGSLTTFTYDFVTRQTVVSNALGDRSIHKHDDKLRIIQITDEADNIQNFEYDDSNNRTKVIDKNRCSTRYGYDSKGNVIAKIDPLGNMTTIEYDSLNNPTSRTDARNQSTFFSYDSKGNLVETVNSQNCTNTIAYDSRGLPELIWDARGNSLSNSYDTAGNLTNTCDALGYVWGYSYDSVGRKVSEVNPNSATNQFVYDANNNLLSVTDPMGYTNSFVYDANNNQVSIQDARGFQAVKSYDAKDRLLSVSNALGGVSSNVYDALDRQIAAVDPLGNVARFVYDPAGNLVAVSNALGQVTSYTYDANGNELTFVNPLGQVIANEYDELNRVVSVTDPLGHTVSYEYDELGRRTKVTDANLQVTRFEYDSMGRLVNVIDAATGTVSLAYDSVGNRTAMTEPNGHTTTYTYDALNRMIQKQEPIGTYQYSYDGAGNRLEMVDALNQTNHYAYDANNRLLSITYPSGTPVTFAYDPSGNRTNMTDTLGTTMYSYDALGRMTNCTDSAGMTVAYAYDANGNRAAMTYPGNKIVNYGFDALNRMTSVSDWLGGVTTNIYDAAGNLVETVNPNGTTARYVFDDAGRLTSLTNALADTTVITEYGLILDGVGNHLASSQVEPLEPLIPAQTVSYAYDQDNRLTNAAGTAFTYDANGNMLTNGANTFVYDYENRLTQAVVGGTNYQYHYDGIGNRMRATRSGVLTRYVLDVNGSLSHVLAETDSGGTVTAYYVYGRGLVSRITAAGVRSCYHFDVRGSVVALSDPAGTLTDTYAYDPFGTIANSSGSTANPFKYVGRYGIMDEGNGLAYIRARYYSPTLGRFVTKDPVTGKDGDSQSLNRYIYALNNPFCYIDINGHNAIADFFGEFVNSLANAASESLIRSVYFAYRAGHWSIPGIQGAVRGGLQGTLGGLGLVVVVADAAVSYIGEIILDHVVGPTESSGISYVPFVGGILDLASRYPVPTYDYVDANGNTYVNGVLSIDSFGNYYKDGVFEYNIRTMQRVPESGGQMLAEQNEAIATTSIPAEKH